MGIADLCALPAVVGILLGWYFGWKAYSRVSDLGHQQHLRPWFLKTAEYYTPEGWRYFRLSFFASTAGAIITILLFLTGC
jgi:hypothetical protein